MHPVEFTYRYSTTTPDRRPHPSDAAAAQARLEEGNRRFAQAFAPTPDGVAAMPHVIDVDPDDVSLRPGSKDVVAQQPYAAILGCADARVPIELIFNEGPNELFVVRIAGNGLGSDVLGSISYAAGHFRDHLKLIVVLGHSNCGAVATAVDHFLTPANYLPLSGNLALRGVLDRLTIVVQASQRRLLETFGGDIARHPGYRQALIVASTVTHAALVACMVAEEIGRQRGGALRTVYGVYEVESRQVWSPGEPGADPNALPGAGRTGLSPAPDDPAAFARMADQLTLSPRLRGPLGAL